MVPAAFVSCLAVPIILILLVRFCKRPMARFHRVLTNRMMGRFAGRLPGFAIVENVGRKTGRLYLTPVNVFRQANEFVIALTYGRESGWVENVLAAGGCTLRNRGVSYQLVEPKVVRNLSRD